MECFRIDESGYTGFNLLNDDQRFQGASAIAIGDDDAERLIKQHFPKLQAPELKYRALSRRQSNHPRLLALMRDLLGEFKSVTYVCDKRFMLTLMFVDYCHCTLIDQILRIGRIFGGFCTLNCNISTGCGAP